MAEGATIYRGVQVLASEKRDQLGPDKMLMPSATDQLTTTEVARLAGITTASLRSYRSRGTGPEPDGYLGATPWWRRQTIDRWLAERPRRGRPAKVVR